MLRAHTVVKAGQWSYTVEDEVIRVVLPSINLVQMLNWAKEIVTKLFAGPDINSSQLDINSRCPKGTLYSSARFSTNLYELNSYGWKSAENTGIENLDVL